MWCGVVEQADGCDDLPLGWRGCSAGTTRTRWTTRDGWPFPPGSARRSPRARIGGATSAAGATVTGRWEAGGWRKWGARVKAAARAGILGCEAPPMANETDIGPAGAAHVPVMLGGVVEWLRPRPGAC